MPALYTSLRVETAWLEAQQAFVFKAQPMTICAYTVDCADVLDLRDPATLVQAGINPADLSCAWEDLASRKLAVPSWLMVKSLIARGIAGVIVPSFAFRARPDDVNAVFWTWGDSKPHLVQVIDDLGRLPRNDQSWR